MVDDFNRNGAVEVEFTGDAYRYAGQTGFSRDPGVAIDERLFVDRLFGGGAEQVVHAGVIGGGPKPAPLAGDLDRIVLVRPGGRARGSGVLGSGRRGRGRERGLCAGDRRGIAAVTIEDRGNPVGKIVIDVIRRLATDENRAGESGGHYQHKHKQHLRPAGRAVLS